MKAVFITTLLLLLTAVSSLFLGPATDWLRLFDVFSGQGSFLNYWQENSSVFELRLSHVLLSVGVGFALASGGRAMQLFLQNPLADPHVVGFSAGSTAAVLLAYLFFPSFASHYFWGFLPAVWLAAAGGAFVTVVFVQLFFWSLARRWGMASLALAGLMINAGIAALLMMIFARLSPTALSQVQAWTLGSIQPHNLPAIGVLLPLMLIASIVLIRMDPTLRLLSFGAEFASANGVRLASTRSWLLGSLVVICATTVCAAGSIGFVGLLVPHVSRRLFSADCYAAQRPMLNALLGSLIVVVADVGSRNLTAPLELPVGVYTAVLSLPFLLMIMAQQRPNK